MRQLMQEMDGIGVRKEYATDDFEREMKRKVYCFIAGPKHGLGELSLCINQQPWSYYCGKLLFHAYFSTRRYYIQ